MLCSKHDTSNFSNEECSACKWERLQKTFWQRIIWQSYFVDLTQTISVDLTQVTSVNLRFRRNGIFGLDGFESVYGSG